MSGSAIRRFLKFAIVVPLAAVFVVFAIANRHFVTVSFDPFNILAPDVSLSAPLFVLISVIAILGVVAGSTVTWLRQRHWRRAARRNAAEARALRQQLEAARRQPTESPATVPEATRTLAMLPPGS